MKLYLRLDEDGFRRLVAGEAVTLAGAGGETAELILADIGWERMVMALARAMGASARRTRAAEDGT